MLGIIMVAPPDNRAAATTTLFPGALRFLYEHKDSLTSYFTLLPAYGDQQMCYSSIVHAFFKNDEVRR